jgi:hypothetical protein
VIFPSGSSAQVRLERLAAGQGLGRLHVARPARPSPERDHALVLLTVRPALTRQPTAGRPAAPLDSCGALADLAADAPKMTSTLMKSVLGAWNSPSHSVPRRRI